MASSISFLIGSLAFQYPIYSNVPTDRNYEGNCYMLRTWKTRQRRKEKAILKCLIFINEIKYLNKHLGAQQGLR